MFLDGQVLVIACFALALNLLLWSRKDNVVAMDVQLYSRDVLHLDKAGCDLKRDRGQVKGGQQVGVAELGGKRHAEHVEGGAHRGGADPQRAARSRDQP